MANLYVKFMRGTPTAYQSLASKDSNTLYFISEEGASTGTLYMGSKMIGGQNTITGATTLGDLTDVVIAEGITNGSLLVYEDEKWVSKATDEVLASIVEEMSGATTDAPGTAGLVPAPAAGQNELFLRGDATWANPVPQTLLDDVASNKSKVDTLIGEDTGLSVREILASALIPEDAQESLDTLTEIADWIQSHPQDASEINTRLLSLETTVNGTEEDASTGLLTRVGNLETTVNALSTAMTWTEIE